MGGNILGSIHGSVIPQTSSLDPQMPAPYEFFLTNEESAAFIGQNALGPGFNTREDDVAEW
jgi:hypothetical protein